MTTASPGVAFYSIGENCLGHGVLQRHGVAPLLTTPFSHARSNIDYATQLVETDFVDMLTPRFLHHEQRYKTRMPVHSLYTCEAGLYEKSVCNGFEFSHHDVIDDAENRASYLRKAQRFLDGLSGTGPACFLYHYRLHRTQDIARVAAKLRRFQELCRARSGRPISVTMFTQRLVGSDDQRRVEFLRPDGIPVAILHTRHKWCGTDPEQFWGRVDDELFARMIGAFEFHAATAGTF